MIIKETLNKGASSGGEIKEKQNAINYITAAGSTFLNTDPSLNTVWRKIPHRLMTVFAQISAVVQLYNRRNRNITIPSSVCV